MRFGITTKQRTVLKGKRKNIMLKSRRKFMCTCAYRVIPNVVLYYFWHLRSAQSSHLYCRKAELFDTRRRILNAHCQLGFLFCCLSRFSIHFSLSRSHSYPHSVFVPVFLLVLIGHCSYAGLSFNVFQ